MTQYDVVVIGSGPGGHTAAIKAAKFGLKVCVVERDALGGTCLNYGCIPTKTLLCKVKGENNYAKIILDKDKIVERLRNGIIALFKKHKIILIQGSASVIGANKVRIEIDRQKEQIIEAKNIIIAAGSEPKPIKGFPFDGNVVFSSRDILSVDVLPKDILIIGAGPEGCEFATIFEMLNLKVTLLEKMDSILPGEDLEISQRLESYLKRSGIEVLTSKDSDDYLETNRRERILICAGRNPAIEGLGLEETGIQLVGRYISVDDYLRTNIPNIYAIGDVIGSGLAHLASYEGCIAAENIAGLSKKVDRSIVPRCVFTHPEVASLGMTENAIEKAGYNFKTVKLPYSALSMSHCAGKTEGFIKLIADKDTGKIFSGAIIGYQATSLIHNIAIAMKFGLSLKDLADTITAHPTFPEIIKEAAASFYGEAIYSMI